MLPSGPPPGGCGSFRSCRCAFAQEKALVAALIDSVQEIEDPVGASDVVPVPFGTHKPAWAAKVFPYPDYFDKFVYKECGRLKRPFCFP